MEGSFEHRGWRVWSDRLRAFFVSYLIALIIGQYFYSFAAYVAQWPRVSLLHILNVALFFPIVPALAALIWRAYRPLQHAPGIQGARIGHFHWCFSGILAFGVWAGGYFLINRLMVGAPTYTLAMGWESGIPFLPEFSLVYLTVYWLFLLAPFTGETPEDSRLYLKGFLILSAVCFAFFILFPVECPRPPFDVVTLADFGLAKIHSADKPVNCFPSMHCAVGMYSALTLLRRNRKNGLLALLLMINVGIATLVTRQHYLADVVGGFLLAALVTHLTYRSRVEIPSLRLEAVLEFVDRLSRK